MKRMGILEAIIFGIVEGVTEFLPVSSTGHLTITEKLLGFPIDDKGITAFTAVIQVGAILATVVYFRKDIWEIITSFLQGLVKPAARTTTGYRMGWGVIIGSIPIAVIGLLFKDQIETTLRSLWFVGIALVGWSGVMYYADRVATQKRPEASITWKDTLIIGVVQCLALIPGVSRSGATMSAGLLRGIDRVAVTRLSFFLAIPALLAAAALEVVSKSSDISNGPGWTATLVATVVSFIVAYASVAWLLKYVSKHDYSVFIKYRIVAGVILLSLLASGLVSAT